MSDVKGARSGAPARPPRWGVSPGARALSALPAAPLEAPVPVSVPVPMSTPARPPLRGMPVRVRRVIVSVLAGGGITAVGLGGPLTGGALASEPSASSSPPSGTSTTPASETPTQTTTTSTTPTGTTTTSGATTPTTTPTPTTSTPASEPPATSTSTTTAPASAPTTTEASKPPVIAPKVVVQRKQQTTQGEAANPTATNPTETPGASTGGSTGSGDIAPAPQLAAVQASALAAMLADSAASTQALDFFRIPLFLLPIYQAAAVQYGVPWQVLAAINEVETDFGADQSVSTAGAIGWMQFMPETWLQYGVDAVNAGYADPYNPVDAIFAAARYLHAAGASTNLRTAILAYNHSEAYVESVLLRARLFASYPPSVIATLTGLTEGSLPVAGARLSASSIVPDAGATGGQGSTQTGASNATAGATLAQPPVAGTAKASQEASALPGSTPAPPPAVSAARAERALNAAAPPSQLSELIARKGAPVVAVEDGRVVGIGKSRKLGRYLVLRDTYGDVFTYAGLGSIAPEYRLPKQAQVHVPKGALAEAEASGDPKPTQAASAGSQLPLTLHVAKPKAAASRLSKHASAAAGSSGQGAPSTGAPSDGYAEAGASGEAGKTRVYAHPGNPDAIAAARIRAQAARHDVMAPGWMRLSKGSVVAQGTVLGHLGSDDESPDATLRFAIRPAGAQSAVDPQPILTNWKQLEIALHPRGAKDGPVLAGATASDAFLLSKAELQSSVLGDPGIKLGKCDREQVAAGKVGSRTLALLVFLSRSGLKPTVGELRCGRVAYTARGLTTSFPPPGTIDIAAINGIPIAGHQGAGTITDITIRTLLTIPSQFAPKRIVSLMKYPGAPSTIAAADYASYIKIELAVGAHGASASKAVGANAKSAAAANKTTAPGATDVVLGTNEWQRLVGQIGSLPTPKLSSKPSASAIRDKQAAPTNRGLGTSVLP
jgi:membrane-bound lytic murein transglycosylase B